jgi:hypothetical protein
VTCYKGHMRKVKGDQGWIWPKYVVCIHGNITVTPLCIRKYTNKNKIKVICQSYCHNCLIILTKKRNKIKKNYSIDYVGNNLWAYMWELSEKILHFMTLLSRNLGLLWSSLLYFKLIFTYLIFNNLLTKI